MPKLLADVVLDGGGLLRRRGEGGEEVVVVDVFEKKKMQARVPHLLGFTHTNTRM